MELSGKKVAVLVEENYQALEFWYSVLRMREAGAEVTVVGTEKGKGYIAENTGYPGIQAKADITAAEANASNFDAVIVPGGYAPDKMRRNADMVKLVREAAQQGKVVAAICHAGWMLASADAIRGKRVTSFHSIKDDMTNAGGQWVNETVVRDGKIITSRMPDDLPAFCREIIAALK